MKASELIRDLQALVDKHGDLPIVATWEGKDQDPVAYRSAPGWSKEHEGPVIIIDADGYHSARERYEHPDDRKGGQT